MLEALRRGAGSLIAKIFIFLLVASFAVWGVADIFRANTDTAVARVGETEVSIDQYRQALRQEIQQLSQRSGNYLTMDQARSLGLDSQVLGRLMAEAALDDEARRRNLHVPDPVVAASIRKDPSFQAPGGQFDRSYFEQYLRATGYSEGAFVREQRDRLLRRAIGEAVGGAPVAPATMTAAFHRYINEQRTGEYILVSAAQAAAEPADEETLRSYYEEHQAEFTAPEYRTVGLLTAAPADIAQNIEVTQEDLEAAYDARRSEFTQPEQRTIEQISFNSVEEAEAAYEAIQGGGSFEDVARDAGLSSEDISLGTLTRDQVVDPSIADAAFSLEQGAVSEPVEGQFSPVLLRVTAIEEGRDPTLDEVAPQLREGLATQRARDQILDIYDQVEDDRASGMTLQEIASSRGLGYRQVTVSQAGQSPEGEQITLPAADQLLSGIFESDIGIETDPVETNGDGYVWYAVQEIAPSHQLAFEDARDQVAQALERDQRQERLRGRTDELMARLEGGATLQEIADELGTAVQTVGPANRTQDTGPFGQAALGLLFTTPQGRYAETSAAAADERVIFRVTGVTVPEFQPDAADPLAQRLQGALANDLLGQYISGLEAELGARVNQEALSVALGEFEQLMGHDNRMLEPSFDAFEERYRLGAAQVVCAHRVADLETPVAAYLKLAEGQPNSFLLESIEGGAARGRYSVIGIAPDLAFRARGDMAEINHDPQGDPEGYMLCAEPTLAALRRVVNETRIDLPEGLPPMASGLFGYMGYDTVRLMEDLGEAGDDPLGLPDAVFVRPTIIVIFDNVRDELTVVTPVRPQAVVTAREAYEAARARIQKVVDRLERPLSATAGATGGEPVRGAPVGVKSADQYAEMVERAKEYIRAGDIFQVVLSQRFEIPFSLPPFAFYRALRRTNPAPFLFFFDLPGFAVAGSSPEILVRVRDDTVTIRPLAGTRPRGQTSKEDEELASDLLSDEKERAEHLMLLDLGRNDVGRVSRPGSVEVTEQFQIERYSQVMHIVSHVEGRLDPARDSIDALVGGFPAGTVSGAPKVRAMQIIDELEGDKRGLYAGAVGYFAANGDMDTCIALRTAVIADGKVHIRAGAGIVAESDPMSEHRECLNKARALFRAAEEAVRFAARNRRPEPVES